MSSFDPMSAVGGGLLAYSYKPKLIWIAAGAGAAGYLNSTKMNTSTTSQPQIQFALLGGGIGAAGSRAMGWSGNKMFLATVGAAGVGYYMAKPSGS